MSSATAPPPAAASPQPAPSASRGGRHRFRRPKRGGNQSGATDAATATPATSTNPPITLLPASVPPQTPVPTSQGRGGGHTHGRGRGGRRGGAASGRTVLGAGGRTFGGQLTTVPATSLQADAPEFKPGQPMPLRGPATRARRMSKSAAPDIATRTHEDIENGYYECAICTSEILRNSKVWSCKTCWTVFHLSCIKKWSKNEGSTHQRQPNQDGEMPPPRQWRCPGCNLPKDDLPTSYTCWCAKEVDPKPIPGIPPHSCGQTCSKPRAPRKCPHPCELLCHAGPCPPCPHTGPTLSCFCGKDVATKRCIDTNYDTGFSCGRICGDILPCGEHTCPRPCHEGLCGSCEVMVDSRCYCGKIEMPISCSERGEEKESSLPDEDAKGLPPFESSEGGLKTWIGSFACDEPCSRKYDCEQHSCEKSCHEQTSTRPHCPLSPDVVNNCPCGKTTLEDLGCTRTVCTDDIPHCDKICLRTLGCGHQCQQKCHSGDCLPCLMTVSISCRCGRTSSSTICHQGTEELPQCSRPCKVLLNCGRHECGERCCPAEKIAGERQAAKRKQKSNSRQAEEFEAEHICLRSCDKVLKCGNPDHRCQELCHRGPCGSCREAIFDEISCHCGMTVLHPPLACGTQPPPCTRQCNRPKLCGHPQVMHHCHTDDEACPKCPYLVQKTCMCGKKMLKNQPCSSTNASCGAPCEKRLKCGIHYCQKPCHRPGECEDADSKPCPHSCGQKKSCGHLDLQPCHAPYPCKEDKPCQTKVIITCECQRRKQEIRCLATKTSQSSEEERSLVCDDECLRLQRNQKLAAALNISADHLDDHIPYSTATLDYFKDHVKWCQIQEREFRVFAADDKEKRLRLKPMTAPQRGFCHSLAEDFGLDSESMDPEPHRHVAIFKTPRFVSAPMKTLSQCIKIRTVAALPTSTPSAPVSAPFNALILSAPRFALTIDELRTSLHDDLATVSPPATITISFLPSDEIVLYSSLDSDSSLPLFTRLKPLVSKTITAHALAASVALCRLDASLNVLRREEDGAKDGGWSQVVKGAPAARTLGRGPTVGARSAFTVLGRAAAKAKEKEAEESVVDNWESAVDAWE